MHSKKLFLFTALFTLLLSSCQKSVQRQRVGDFTYLPPDEKNWRSFSENELSQLPDSSLSSVQFENTAAYENSTGGIVILVQNCLFNGTEETDADFDKFFDEYKEKISSLGKVTVNEFKPEGDIRIKQTILVFEDLPLCNLKTFYFDQTAMQALSFDIMMNLNEREAYQGDLQKLFDSVEHFVK